MTEKDQYAFPVDRYTQGGIKSGHGQGMSLRDWFAGQALAGIIANPSLADMLTPNYIKQYAESSYSIADAMLEERK